LLENSGNVIATGKMLRSRLAYRLAGAGLVSQEDMTSAAAAVEVFNPNRPKPQITAAQTRFRFVVFIKFCRSS